MKTMNLPRPVQDCLTRLEQNGFAAYAVGGCVRDACLGLTPNDYDLCTGALPEQTASVFWDRSRGLTGARHGTVAVETDWGTVEITTFRAEGDYRDHRHPGWVKFVPRIREDLARRDFTVNAMAWSPSRGLCDPFGGEEDLRRGILRTVGDPFVRFQEDALRILRGIRFSARFRLVPEENTLKAMISRAELLKTLPGERILEELSGALVHMDAEDLKRFAPVLSVVIPELGPMVDFDQHSPHHAYDLYTHTALVTQQVPEDLTLRWAALLHDIGKVPSFTRDENGRGHFYGHAPTGARMADRVHRALKAPAVLREQAVTLIGEHMTALEPDRQALCSRIADLGWDTTEKLWYLQRADLGSKGTDTPADREHFRQVREMLDQLHREDPCLSLSQLAVTGKDLMDLGLRGRDIGDTLQRLLKEVVAGNLENKKEALLRAVHPEA